MTVNTASQNEIDEFLADHADWRLEQGKLHREFVFADFVQAFGFMAQVALVAEAANHHPEWRNVYRRVVVDLTTHEAGGITERDFMLARRMGQIAAPACLSGGVRL